jgi:two-component system sensor histidine kinase PilS (NtrC family)
MDEEETKSKQIKTCSLGKGFYLPVSQAWGTLNVFNIYQLTLSLAFLLLFISKKGPSLFGQLNPSLFLIASISYVVVAIASIFFLKKSTFSYATQVQSKVFAEIIILTIIMHASGGITSGIGVLLAVTVAAGGLLVGGLCTLAFAALATFLVLGEQLYASYTHAFVSTAYTYAGVLSASFFAIALLAMVMAKRVEVSEGIAKQQGKDIYDLEQLNSYIIKHLQSGIIVVDAEHNVRLSNEAAAEFLGKPLIWGNPLSSEAIECWHLYNRWLRNPEKDNAVLNSKSSHQRLKLRFNALSNLREPAFIIFIDDLSAIDQQIQQGKLASLGHLTASIAHEIRNPLGAISHAGQLLSESEDIKDGDKRLLNIIHNHSDRVNSIVKSILQLSRQEQTHSEAINIAEWLVQFEKEFKEQFGLDTPSFTTNLPNNIFSINFDSNHLEQILNNLCSNALTHGSSKGEPITITIEQKPNIQQTTITISDTGLGINKTIAEKIFDPFYTTSSTGTGLGLYISNQLAEINNAKLSYHQPQHGGSCFTLTITNKSLQQ